jgi:hypothetical protein
MDFITDLPISNGFDSIFIVVNQELSKGVILCPCNKTINAEETIKLYIDNVFIQYGLPDVIISDRGPQFASNVFNGIFNAIGVKHRMSTAYHPQTDGQTERYNQELEAYLRIYCAYKPDEWSNKLSLAQFAHNARTHEAIKQSPFQLMYGTKPVALPEVSEKTNSPVANDRINQLYKSREEALAAHCYNTVRTPTLCKPDTSDRPYCFSFYLLNLATPLLSYAVRLVLLTLVPLSLLPCYLFLFHFHHYLVTYTTPSLYLLRISFIH